MKKKRSLDATVMIAAVIGSLVLLNIIGVSAFGRLDLTSDKRFTLSEATKSTLRTLDDPITVRAYFTKDLPPPFSTNTRYVQDLLEEFYAHGDGQFRYEFIDPSAEETEEDKEKKKDIKRDIFGRSMRQATSIERELQSIGIPPVQVRVNKDDKLEVQRAYMGIAIKFGEKTEVIPQVRDLGGLEYDLTVLVRKLTRSPKKVAFVMGDDSIDIRKEMSRVFNAVQQICEVQIINLNTDPNLPDELDAIIVVSSKVPYSEDAQKKIDEFVMSGRSAAFLVDAVKPQLSNLSTEETDHGLKPLLQTYGVEIGDGLVLDAQCATISVQQQRGWMRISQPVPYPFIPLIKSLDAKHPLTRGLAQVAFPFMSPLTLRVTDGGDVKGEVLVKSSAKSWIESPPYNLDPMQRWTPTTGDPQGLLVALSGAIPSHFGAPALASSDSDAVATSARVLVAGGTGFLADSFMSAPAQAFVMNLFDWLVQDEALLAVRTRGLGAAPIDEVGDGTRHLVKFGNIAGLPFLFVAFGLFRWQSRERRRSRVQV